MDELTDFNELLTTKSCSPLIIYGVVLICSFVCIYILNGRLKKFNSYKMDNLYNLFMFQELKYLIILGVILFGLCQYKKAELAWIFLIFPVIYVIIQNVLIFINIISAYQNTPQDLVSTSTNYGLDGGMVLPKPSNPEKPTPPPVVSTPSQSLPSQFTYPSIGTPSNTPSPLGGSQLGGSPF
jgi:hypothetical protein